MIPENEERKASGPMKPEIKAKWLEALRGGEYQQGRHKLMTQTPTGPQYCCLGVLAEITRDENAEGRSSKQIEYTGVLTRGMAEHVGLPISPMVPCEIAKKHCGLGAEVFHGLPENQVVEIWKLNDEYGMTFPQLANVIEEAF